MSKESRIFFMAGVLFAGTGVALGAFGAHALRDSLTPRLLEVFETGVRYQMYHAFGLFAVSWLSHLYENRLIVLAGRLFIIGVVLFSGSLYLLAILSLPAMGIVTPFGGLAFIIGWALLFYVLLRRGEQLK